MNFYNQVIDKKGLKRIVSWFVDNYGPTRTAQLIEDFQFLGFHYATRAGLSLGFDDLRIPPTKTVLLEAAQKQVLSCENNYLRGQITASERYQKLIDIWTTTSENLKEEVIQNFQKTPLNPLYMMAFSGARGNISQVRQLVGMRGLMSDSGGGIIDFPIRSNFREGLSVTEYVISCYGARKGLIDTALRTADSGYLTRRLVDVAHAMMITEIDCGTTQSISVAPLEKNLLGRVLAENIRGGGAREASGDAKQAAPSAKPLGGCSGGVASMLRNQPPMLRKGRSPLAQHPGSAPAQDASQHAAQPLPRNRIIARKNQDISAVLAREILACVASRVASPPPHQMIRVRSPLSCEAAHANLCQMCYGWNLAQGRFVSIGDAVGILAAQSIGEPGTQLTMRTFHTGGIFSTDVEDKIFAPHDGFVSYQKLPKGCKLRSVHGETGFFSQEPLQIRISSSNKVSSGSILQLPAQSLLFVYPGKFVLANDLCAEISRLTPNLGSVGPAPLAMLPNRNVMLRKLRSIHQPLTSAAPSGSARLRPKHPTPDSKQGRSRSTTTPLAKTLDAASPDIQNAAYKLVFSEIQGQVSLGYGQSTRVHGFDQKSLLHFGASGFSDMDEARQSNSSYSSVLPNEVWVLAAERLSRGLQKKDITETLETLGARKFQKSGISQRFERGPVVAHGLLMQSKLVAKPLAKHPRCFGCAASCKASVAPSSIAEPVESTSRFLGSVGDLFYWKGYRGERRKLQGPEPSCAASFASGLRERSASSYLQKIVREPRSRNEVIRNDKSQGKLSFQAFEVRDSSGDKAVLPLREQKCPVSHGNESKMPRGKALPQHPLAKHPDMPSYASEKENGGLRPRSRFTLSQIKNTYVLGELIRSHDEFLKTEYSAQIIRKISSRVRKHEPMRAQCAAALENKSSLGCEASREALSTLVSEGSVAAPGYVGSRASKWPGPNFPMDLNFTLVLRRVQPHLVSGLQSPVGGGALHPSNLRPLGSMVQEKDVLFQLLLPQAQSKTGDIVQGLPKIEQLFEGRGRHKQITSPAKLSSFARLRHPQVKLGQEYQNVALRSLQQRLVEEIQSVYQSQGVEIADKHIEIIVRLMTSKVKILEKGKTSFFPDDIVDLHHVKAANLPESFYEPIVLGITKVAFLTESFVSAASFQETKRVLMNSAIQNRVDFLHGLKENVIVGRLIPAGTGFVAKHPGG